MSEARLIERIEKLKEIIAEYEKAMEGWDGYSRKDGYYIDNIDEYFEGVIETGSSDIKYYLDKYQN